MKTSIKWKLYLNREKVEQIKAKDKRTTTEEISSKAIYQIVIVNGDFKKFVSQINVLSIFVVEDLIFRSTSIFYCFQVAFELCNGIIEGN